MNRPTCRPLTTTLLAALALSAAGCYTRVTRVEPTAVQTMSTDFDSTDLQQSVASLMDSMLGTPAVMETTAKSRPVLMVDRLRNKTMQQLDTESITDSIRTRLLRSGKFRFVDRAVEEAMTAELGRQHNPDRIDPANTVKFGRQYGAQYMLSGNFSEIATSQGRTEGRYYKITLNLINIETGLIDWTDEKQIMKMSKRRFLGL